MAPRIRPIVAAILVVGLSACGGGDDTDAAAERSTTTTAPATTTTIDPAATAAIDDLVSWWNEIMPGVERDNWVSTPIDPAAVVREVSAQGGEVFAVRLNDGAVFGGRVEGGEVTSMHLGVDPSSRATASIVQLAMLRNADDPNDTEPVARLYRDVLDAPEPRSEHLVVGDDDAYVIARTDGADDGERLMTVSMSKLVDAGAATARADADRTDVLALLT